MVVVLCACVRFYVDMHISTQIQGKNNTFYISHLISTSSTVLLESLDTDSTITATVEKTTIPPLHVRTQFLNRKPQGNHTVCTLVHTPLSVH
jgi:hypothetical protein